jgi:hypothetical protein
MIRFFSVVDEVIDPLTDNELALYRSADLPVEREETLVLSHEESNYEMDEWRRAMSFYFQSDDEELEAMSDDIPTEQNRESEAERGIGIADDDDDQGYYFIDGRPVPVREVRAKSKQLVEDIMADFDSDRSISEMDWEINGRIRQEDQEPDHEDYEAFYFIDGKPVPVSEYQGDAEPSERGTSGPDDDDGGFIFIDGKMVPVREVGIEGRSTEFAEDKSVDRPDAGHDILGYRDRAGIDQSVTDLDGETVPESGTNSKTGVEISSDDEDIK